VGDRGEQATPDLQAQIEEAVGIANPVLCNLRITLAHYELSGALHEIIGADSGANFHTWAVWGSKQAGETIREQDIPYLPRAGLGVGAVLGAGAGRALTPGARRGRRVAAALVGASAGAAALGAAGRGLLGGAAKQILGGNVTVLADIGRQTARFVESFSRASDRTEDRLEKFLAGLRPGPAMSGGQDLLRGAYRHYFAASDDANVDQRDEFMLCANLLAILHEHERLEPYIDGSVPFPFRRFVTAHLLGFTVGAEAMRVSRDVPGVFPETLRTIETPELQSLLDGPGGWDRTPDCVEGSGAHDWTKLSDRMNFIVDLFRTRQRDPELFKAPFEGWQREMIAAGEVPGGRL
jgi:hypothetical protein